LHDLVLNRPDPDRLLQIPANEYMMAQPDHGLRRDDKGYGFK
jgi:hypothetical protein